MNESQSNTYIITVNFGKIKKHGLIPYRYEEAISARNRLIAVGVNPNRITIIPYESIFL